MFNFLQKARETFGNSIQPVIDDNEVTEKELHQIQYNSLCKSYSQLQEQVADSIRNYLDIKKGIDLSIKNIDKKFEDESFTKGDIVKRKVLFNRIDNLKKSYREEVEQLRTKQGGLNTYLKKNLRNITRILEQTGDFTYKQYDSLGKKRSEMPQIDKDNIDDFLIHFSGKSNKAKVKKVTKRIDQLLPTQCEFDDDKILSIMYDYQNGNLEDNTFLISKDNRLLDATHRWCAILELEPNKEVTCYQVNLPMKELLRRAKLMKISRKEDVQGNEVQKTDKNQLINSYNTIKEAYNKGKIDDYTFRKAYINYQKKIEAIKEQHKDIPNYRLAKGDKTCGNCGAFKQWQGRKGYCEMFDSEVRSDYICDDWVEEYVEKAYYKDNPKNRKLGRVGKWYGGGKEEEKKEKDKAKKEKKHSFKETFFNKTFEEYIKENKEIVKEGENKFMSDLSKELGLKNSINIVDGKTYNNVDGIEIFRGTNKEEINNLGEKDDKFSFSMFGSGIYFAANKEGAYGGELYSTKIKSDSNIANFEELSKKQLKEFMDQQDKEDVDQEKLLKAWNIYKDVGVYAMAKGIDAIYKENEDYYLIINKDSLITSKENKNIKKGYYDTSEYEIDNEQDKEISIKKFADVILTSPAGNILLLKRNKHDELGPGEYVLPGGTQEAGEESYETAARELQEETNLSVDELTYERTFDNGNGTSTDVYSAITDQTDNIILDINEHEDYIWVSPNDIDQLKLFKDTEKRVKEIKNIEIVKKAFNEGKISLEVFQKAYNNYIQKAKRAQVGEIREWKSGKYKKQPSGKWAKVGEGKQQAKKEEKIESISEEDLFNNFDKRKDEFDEIEQEKNKVDALKDISTKDLVSMAGGVPDDNVEIIKVGASHDETLNDLRIMVKADGYRYSRTFEIKGNKIKSIYNGKIDIEDKGKGLGSKIFANQVYYAKKNNVEKINCFASGSPDNIQGANGYYTWARLGYDFNDEEEDIYLVSKAKFKKLVNSSENKEVQACQTLPQLMSLPEGRKLWKEKGFAFEGKFDLSDNSESLKIFNTYYSNKVEALKSDKVEVFDENKLTEGDLFNNFDDYKDKFKEVEKVKKGIPALKDIDTKTLISAVGDTPTEGNEINNVYVEHFGDKQNGVVQISVKSKDFYYTRFIGFENGKLENDFENDSIDISKTGEGVGTKIFANQVVNAKKMGFDSMFCRAADQSMGDYNGYYTWARLGYDFDRDIEKNRFRQLLDNSGNDVLKQCETLPQLMALSEGQKFWKENGFAFKGRFNLQDDSESMKLFNKYYKEKF